MLRAMFDGIEKAMGPSLDGLASFVWTFGLLLVALQVLAPFARVALELGLSRAGLQRAWVIQCGACGARSVLGATCVKCGQPLPVPVLARVFARGRPPGPTRLRAKWTLSLAGALAFLWGSMILMARLAPEGPTERLFAGAALVAWAGAGLFLGRALGPRGGGPVSRARELAFAAAALTVLGAAAFLEQTVHPIPERVLGQVRVFADSVELDGGGKLAISSPQLGLELQLIEHPSLGLSRVLPLAWVGATRSPIELSGTDAWLRDTSWKNAEAVMAVGGQVKRRTETFPIAPGGRYELVLREHDVLLRGAR